MIKANLEIIDETSDICDDESSQAYSMEKENRLSRTLNNKYNGERPRTNTLEEKPLKTVTGIEQSFDYFGLGHSERQPKYEEYGMATKVKLPDFLLSRE